MYNRPRKRRPDQIPLRWVHSGIASRSATDRSLQGTEYNSSFHPLAHERLPPIKQKEELADYKSTDIFEKYSLYKSTFPPIASRRPDFPRPPDQLPKSNEPDPSGPISSYKKEFGTIPSGNYRPIPVPNKATWEPEADPVALQTPMVSLFHNDFKPIYLKDKTRSIRHDMGYVLPHYPLEGKSASAEAFCWKYQPKGESYAPKAVYNESEKFNAMSEQKQSYTEYRPEIYAKVLTEEELELDERSNYSRPRALRKGPEGPSVDILEHQPPPRPIVSNSLPEKSKTTSNKQVEFNLDSKPKPVPEPATTEVTKLPEIMTKSDIPTEKSNKIVKEEKPTAAGTKTEEVRKEKEAQKCIDNYKQSLYSTTYKSDY